jgi:hypothetical protein
MILVDSSVIIDALRKPDPKLQHLFNTLQPAICGIVVAEVLHGARDAADYSKLAAALSSFPQVVQPQHALVPAAIELIDNHTRTAPEEVLETLDGGAGELDVVGDTEKPAQRRRMQWRITRFLPLCVAFSLCLCVSVVRCFFGLMTAGRGS